MAGKAAKGNKTTYKDDSNKLKEERRRNRKGSGSVVYHKPSDMWYWRIKINKKLFDGYTKTEKEGYKAIDDIKVKARLGLKSNKRMSYDDLLDDWLAMKRSGKIGKQSYDRIVITVDKHIRPGLGFYDLDKVNELDIRELLDGKAAERSWSDYKKIYDAIKASLTYARQKRLILANPCDLIEVKSKTDEVFKTKNKDSDEHEDEIEIFTDGEARRFIAAASETFSNGVPRYKNGSIYLFQLYTGVRIGEATTFRWKNYNPKTNVISIRSTAVHPKNADGIVETQEQKYTKSKRNRSFAVNSDAANLLNSIDKKYDYVWASKDGKLLRPHTLQDTFDAILRRAGIAHKTTHICRHTFASNLLRNGVDIAVVSRILGHKDVRTTYNYYISIIEEQKAQAIKVIEGLYDKPDGGGAGSKK